MEGPRQVGHDGGRKRVLPLLGIFLLLGTPQVLALPAPFASDGFSLALSSLLPVVSLAGLFGAAVAAAKGGSGRLVAFVGFASTAIYLALSWWVALGWSWATDGAPLGVAATFILDVMGMAAAGIGMFSCCYMACAGSAETLSALPASPCRALACALAAPAVLSLAARFLPNWTAMRVAVSFSGPDGRLFAESVSLGNLAAAHGLCPLAAGVPVASLFTALPSLAWGILMVALGTRPRTMTCGVCFGLFVTWTLCALFPGVGHVLIWSSTASVALLSLAAVLFAASCYLLRQDARGTADGGAPFPSKVALSPRESEALRLRLDGLSSQRAAERMGVSASTVRNLQARALAKLGVESLGELSAGTISGPGAGTSSTPTSDPMPPLLLALLTGAVLVAAARAQRDWAAAPSETMVLGLSLSCCLLLCGARRNGHSSLTWYELGACAFVGILVGLLPLASLVTALLALAILMGERDRWPGVLHGLLCALGLGMCLGGYASGLLPRLPALLALASNNEGAMLLAVLTGAIAGVFCLTGMASCVLTLRSVADHLATPVEEADGGQDARRFSAYLVSRGLNATEVDVAGLVLKGMTSVEIASRLSLTRGAVNSARRGAYRKLGIHSRAELVGEYERLLN